MKLKPCWRITCRKPGFKNVCNVFYVFAKDLAEIQETVTQQILSCEFVGDGIISDKYRQRLIDINNLCTEQDFSEFTEAVAELSNVED